MGKHISDQQIKQKEAKLADVAQKKKIEEERKSMANMENQISNEQKAIPQLKIELAQLKQKEAKLADVAQKKKIAEERKRMENMEKQISSEQKAISQLKMELAQVELSFKESEANRKAVLAQI